MNGVTCEIRGRTRGRDSGEPRRPPPPVAARRTTGSSMPHPSCSAQREQVRGNGRGRPPCHWSWPARPDRGASDATRRTSRVRPRTPGRGRPACGARRPPRRPRATHRAAPPGGRGGRVAAVDRDRRVVEGEVDDRQAARRRRREGQRPPGAAPVMMSDAATFQSSTTSARAGAAGTATASDAEGQQAASRTPTRAWARVWGAAGHGVLLVGEREAPDARPATFPEPSPPRSARPPRTAPPHREPRRVRVALELDEPHRMGIAAASATLPAAGAIGSSRRAPPVMPPAAAGGGGGRQRRSTRTRRPAPAGWPPRAGTQPSARRSPGPPLGPTASAPGRGPSWTRPSRPTSLPGDRGRSGATRRGSGQPRARGAARQAGRQATAVERPKGRARGRPRPRPDLPRVLGALGRRRQHRGAIREPGARLVEAYDPREGRSRSAHARQAPGIGRGRAPGETQPGISSSGGAPAGPSTSYATWTPLLRA